MGSNCLCLTIMKANNPGTQVGKDGAMQLLGGAPTRATTQVSSPNMERDSGSSRSVCLDELQWGHPLISGPPMSDCSGI